MLRAFASGSVGLSGTEAVANGVPAFQRPEGRNAQTVLVAMATLFGTIFLGFGYLAGQLGIVPDPAEEQTVVSLLGRVLVGEGWLYYVVQFSTALILVLAANTAFNGFPRLASVLAQDQYLPRQFSYRGDRLASGRHPCARVHRQRAHLGLRGQRDQLIPLYTVGVFVAFTLSQAGMVRHWWRRRSRARLAAAPGDQRRGGAVHRARHPWSSASPSSRWARGSCWS